jgi:plastocyanin
MATRLKSMAKIASALCVLSLAPSSWGSEPTVHVIVIDKLSFGAAPERLRVNDIVEWDNSDILRHTATATDGGFDIDLQPGAKGRTTVKRTGIVAYFCRFHPGMKGRLEIAP